LDVFKNNQVVRKYVELYLERSFLKNYHEYSRVKPIIDEILWIGDNSRTLGIPITPTFYNGKWNNDKSEVRKLDCDNWYACYICHCKGGDSRPNSWTEYGVGRLSG
jgi:hypothetical protein